MLGLGCINLNFQQKTFRIGAEGDHMVYYLQEKKAPTKSYETSFGEIYQ
jgi:hypothetical protein